MNVPRAIRGSRTIEELVEVIGTAPTMRLIDRLGGTRIYVPHAPGPHHPLSQAIGLKAATTLAATYRSMWLDLPKPHARRARALEAALSGQMKISEVALAFDYTERQIYAMMAEYRTRADRDEAQGDLFSRLIDPT